MHIEYDKKKKFISNNDSDTSKQVYNHAGSSSTILNILCNTPTHILNHEVFITDRIAKDINAKERFLLYNLNRVP